MNVARPTRGRARGRSIVDGTGRAKAYRPLPPGDRAAALRHGLAAYERGDFFEAHEALEPAWMGAEDPAERDLYQGLIKLAAAFVHAVRGNPRGTAQNLRGARERLARAHHAIVNEPIDVEGLVAAIDARLAGEGSSADAPIPIPRRGRGRAG